MKLINGRRYRGTVTVSFTGIFSPAETSAAALRMFGFRDVETTTTIPDGWPSDHRDADVFAYGTWDKPTGDYPVPDAVTWIDDVTVDRDKQYAPGQYYVIVSPLPIGLRDSITADSLSTFLRERFDDVVETVHDTETLFSFRASVPFPWEWTGLRTSKPEKGDGHKEFELTPGQREYVEGSANWVKDIVKGAAVVGVGFLVLNYFMNRR